LKELRFPRSFSLTAKADFNSVFDKSLKVTQRHLVLLYKPNEKSHSRLGVIVGKRVANLAVSRNRIKRVVRESFRCNQVELQGWDIIVIARQQCDTLCKHKLRKGIDDLWKKVIAQSPKS
jgi:ribonuclease P protein component